MYPLILRNADVALVERMVGRAERCCRGSAADEAAVCVAFDLAADAKVGALICRAGEASGAGSAAAATAVSLGHAAVGC